MNYKIVSNTSEIDKKAWTEFITQHPNGNFFQTPNLNDFYKYITYYKPITLFCLNNKNKISGILLATIQKEKGLIKSKFSTRCIIYGGPVLNNNNEEVADLLLKDLIKTVKNKSIYIEFRNIFDISKQTDIFRKNGFEYKKHFNFILKINDLDDSFKKLNPSKRRQIRKSIEAGAEICEAKELNNVSEFYMILKNLYKTKIKKPLPDFNFFEKFFYTPELGKYLLIKYENKIIGGIMCALFKDTIYEWYICGNDKGHKGIYPSVLATWAPIKYAAENGIKYFDFLGAGSIDDYGVREFKSKFGGELVCYGRYLRINKPLLYKIGKLGLKIMNS